MLNKTDRKAALIITLAATLAACGEQADSTANADVPPPPAASTQAVAPRAPAVSVPPSDLLPLPQGEGGNEALLLKAGQTALGDIVSPKTGKIVALDVDLGTFFNSTTGSLKLNLCKGEQCASGMGDLLSSLDNTPFTIVLDAPLAVEHGDKLSYELTKDGGDVDVVIWTFPAAAGGSQKISVQEGQALVGRTAKLSLHYAK